MLSCCGVFVLRTISLFGSRVPATKASSTSYLSHLLTRLPFMSNTVQYVFMSVFELQDVRILPRSYYISSNVLRLRKVGITAAHSEFTSVAMPSGKRQRVAAKPVGGARPQMSRAQEPGARPPARPPARPLVLVTVWGSARHNCAIAAGKAPPAIPISHVCAKTPQITTVPDLKPKILLDILLPLSQASEYNKKAGHSLIIIIIPLPVNQQQCLTAGWIGPRPPAPGTTAVPVPLRPFSSSAVRLFSLSLSLPFHTLPR